MAVLSEPCCEHPAADLNVQVRPSLSSDRSQTGPHGLPEGKRKNTLSTLPKLPLGPINVTF